MFLTNKYPLFLFRHNLIFALFTYCKTERGAKGAYHTKAIIRYPGAKWSLANWIISHFPEEYEKMVYLEPFVGSGAVFFNKLPGAVETVNDLNGDIVNLFKVLREYPEELKQLLLLTPYAREEYDNSFLPCENDIEKARRYIVKTTQAIGAKLDGSKCGWRNHKQPKICKWGNITDTISEAAKRLRGDATHLVQIENMDALRLIERYNSDEVLMYLDPPYVRSTRKGGRLYSHEMTDDEQLQLLEIITRSQAKIVILGYDSEMYNNALCSWYRFQTETRTTSTELVKEFIWTNFEPPQRQITLFERCFQNE